MLTRTQERKQVISMIECCQEELTKIRAELLGVKRSNRPLHWLKERELKLEYRIKSALFYLKNLRETRT